MVAGAVKENEINAHNRFVAPLSPSVLLLTVPTARQGKACELRAKEKKGVSGSLLSLLSFSSFIIHHSSQQRLRKRMRVRKSIGWNGKMEK